MTKLFSRPLFASVIVFLVAFIVYLQTMAPGVPFIDGGELATAVSTLGICHPTGYPLFTFIGYLFAHLPIAAHVIVRLNIMASFFTALGAASMVFLVHELAGHWFSLKRAASTPKQKGSRPEETEEPSSLPVLVGFVTGIAAAFSGTWWAQSNGIEVYPLHVFFVPTVLTFFFRMLRIEGTAFGKNPVLFALTLGLSFSNHLTTILLAPACLYMYFAIGGFSGQNFKRLMLLAVPFVIGLLPYVYLPIRAAQYPLMDWGHPADPKLFLKQFTGGQYSIWMNRSEAVPKNWAYFWHEFPTEFSLLGLLILVVGCYALIINTASKRLHFASFVLLLFAGCLAYSMRYDIHDIAQYFLVAYVACLIAMACAVAFVLDLVQKRGASAIVLAALILALGIGGAEIATSYHEVDESGNHMVDDYTMNMLNNLPPNAIIFTTAWDFWTSGAFYYQLVENVRPDVLVVDAAMLRDRPWYYSYLQQRAPEVMRRVKPEMDAFLVQLRAFDRDEPFDQVAIGDRYKEFTEALVARNLDRPIYAAPEVMQQRDGLFAPSFKMIPAGIALRMWPRDTIFDVPMAKIQWRDEHYRERSYYTDNTRLLQAMAFAMTGQVYAGAGKIADARSWTDLALRLRPDMNADPTRLQPRDRDFAYTTNEQFEKIEKLRAALK